MDSRFINICGSYSCHMTFLFDNSFFFFLGNSVKSKNFFVNYPFWLDNGSSGHIWLSKKHGTATADCSWCRLGWSTDVERNWYSYSWLCVVHTSLVFNYVNNSFNNGCPIGVTTICAKIFSKCIYFTILHMKLTRTEHEQAGLHWARHIYKFKKFDQAKIVLNTKPKVHCLQAACSFDSLAERPLA